MSDKQTNRTLLEHPLGRLGVMTVLAVAICLLLFHALGHGNGFELWLGLFVVCVVAGVLVPVFLAVRHLEQQRETLAAEVAKRARAEQKLSETMAKYRAIAQSFPDGAVLMFDSQQRFVVADGVGLSRFGFAAEELLGKTPLEVFEVGVGQRVERAVEAALADEESIFDITYWGRLVQMHVLPVRGRVGAPKGMVVVRDVTEARASESALAEGERRMSTLLSNMPGMVYRCIKDEKRTMEFVSDGCFKLTGYRPYEMVLNREISWPELVHPDDRDQLHKEVSVAVEEQRPFVATYRIRTSFGSEKWVWERGVSIWVEEGAFWVLEGIILDITERQLAEDRMRQAYAELDQIFNSTSDGLSLMDLDMQFVRVNEPLCRMLGFSENEMLGRKCFDATPGVGCDTPLCPVQRVREGLERAVNEFVLKADDGSARYFEVSTVPFRDAAKETVGYLSSIRETTARVHAEQEAYEREVQLTQADRLASLGTLVAGVAHEINNPNTVISLNAPLLGEMWEDARRVLDDCLEEHGDFTLGGAAYSTIRDDIGPLHGRIVDSSRRIRNIVADLKGFARQDEVSYNQQVDLTKVARAAAGLVENTIKKSTRQFSLKLPDAAVVVLGDFQRLEQVVVNALINACEALETQQQAVTMEVFISEESAIIEIRDQGRGMGAVELNHALDPFYTTKQQSGGTGLGLSVSHGIVEKHGGNIEFTSVLEEGTVCRITLPLREVQGGHADAIEGRQ